MDKHSPIYPSCSRCARERVRFVSLVPRAFTMVELLVVISIIAVLIALLMPVLSAARRSAVRTQCLSQLRHLMLATTLYANNNDGLFPSRNIQDTNPNCFGYPHQMKRTTNGRYDLNSRFITPYLRDRETMLFCPDSPMSSTSVDAAGDVLWSSYQYFVFHKGTYWNVTAPYVDLGRLNNIRGIAPMWSCFTQIKPASVAASHGRQPNGKPKGMNAAMSDGSARWVDWVECEGYWTFGGEIEYWPKYRKP